MSLKAPPLKLPVDYTQVSFKMKRKVREEYVRQQKGLCAYCQEPLEDAPIKRVETAWINPRQFPKGMFDHTVHLDHDHSTGLTRGAVHAKCNAYMWQYEGR